MTFRLACGDVMPGCTAHFESDDRGDLLQRVASHAATDHGITTVTPEVERAIAGSITSVS